MPDLDTLIADIARRHLGIETLEPRGLDRFDFHEVSVATLKAALRAAFEEGARTAREGKKE